jgi:hypothetical protein
MIEEPVGDDPIGTPLKVDSPAPPGAQERNPASLQRREGGGCARGGHRLADYNGTRLGPVVQPPRVRGLAAIVRQVGPTKLSSGSQ